MSPRSLRPLAGIQVVSLATNLPGPLAVAGLRDLGASPTSSTASWPLAVAAPSWYAELTQGVEVRRADLKSRSGLEELTRLLDTADVLVTAMRPSAFCRLGLGDLSDRYPRLCHVEIVGYDGADEEVAGHDLTYQARYGTIRPPHLPLVPVADTVGGERAISAALALLLARGQHDSGGHQRITLDAAAYDSAAALRHGLFGNGAPLGGALPSYNIYATPTATSPWGHSNRTSRPAPEKYSIATAHPPPTPAPSPRTPRPTGRIWPRATTSRSPPFAMPTRPQRRPLTRPRRPPPDHLEEGPSHDRLPPAP